jgi:branched-chain amino acid aminotransferase
MPLSAHPFSEVFLAPEASPEIGSRRAPRRAEFIWVDRELMPSEQAAAHLLSPAVRFGPGVVVRLRAYGTASGPALFQLRAHLARFLALAGQIGFDDRLLTVTVLRDVIWRVIRANDFYECHVRLALSLEASLALESGGHRPVLAVTAEESFPGRERELWRAGLRLTVSPVTRSRTGRGAGGEGSSQWHSTTALARNMAAQAGYDDAVLLDEQGYVSDCGGEQVAMVKEGVVWVAPMAADEAAVTGEALALLARQAGYRLEIAPLEPAQLAAADELLVCGTTREITPVRQVDGTLIGEDVPGPATLRLQEHYVNCVHGRHRLSRRWLDYMDRAPEPLY